MPQEQIDAAQEGIAAGGARYKPRPLPAQNVSLPLNEAKKGRLAREVGNKEFSDTVALQILREKGTREMEFSYRDAGQAADGDYYYIRVTQVDGEQAWSSPVWVGGK